MNDIFHNFDAPCTSSKTIVAHLMRHSEILTSLKAYKTCPGYFCLAQLPRNEAVTYCSVFRKSLEELVTRKEHGTVQYIPLIARIAASVKNKKSYETLYDNFQSIESSNGLLRD